MPALKMYGSKSVGHFSVRGNDSGLKIINSTKFCTHNSSPTPRYQSSSRSIPPTVSTLFQNHLLKFPSLLHPLLRGAMNVVPTVYSSISGIIHHTREYIRAETAHIILISNVEINLLPVTREHHSTFHHMSPP